MGKIGKQDRIITGRVGGWGCGGCFSEQSIFKLLRLNGKDPASKSQGRISAGAKVLWWEKQHSVIIEHKETV